MKTFLYPPVVLCECLSLLSAALASGLCCMPAAVTGDIVPSVSQGQDNFLQGRVRFSSRGRAAVLCRRLLSSVPGRATGTATGGERRTDGRQAAGNDGDWRTSVSSAEFSPRASHNRGTQGERLSYQCRRENGINAAKVAECLSHGFYSGHSW